MIQNQDESLLVVGNICDDYPIHSMFAKLWRVARGHFSSSVPICVECRGNKFGRIGPAAWQISVTGVLSLSWRFFVVKGWLKTAGSIADSTPVVPRKMGLRWSITLG
jgi:hypothetical protein